MKCFCRSSGDGNVALLSVRGLVPVKAVHDGMVRWLPMFYSYITLIYIYTQAFARWDKSNEIWDQDSFWCHFLVWHSVFQHHSLVVGHQHYCTCKLLVQATWCSGCFEAWLWRFCAAVSGWQAYPGAFPQTKKNADETGNRMTGWRRFGMGLPCLPSGFRH